MAVITHQSKGTISVNSLQQVLHEDDLIIYLARELVVGLVDGQLELASEMPNKINSYAAAESFINDSKEMLKEYVEELLTSFRNRLYDAIEQTEIDIKSIKFTKDGIEDADVVIS